MPLVQQSTLILKILIVSGHSIKQILSKKRSKSQNWIEQGLLGCWDDRLISTIGMPMGTS